MTATTTDLLGELAPALLAAMEEPLPDTVLRQTRRTLLNVIGTAIGASRHPGMAALLGGHADGLRAGAAIVLGRTELVDPLTAATAAGFAAHVDDYDDTHLATVIHPGAASLGALVAAISDVRCDGRRAVKAIALGCEVQLRLGVAISPDHYDQGWHITGTCGVIGAAVTSALLMGCTTAELRDAMALASVQVLGHREGFGTHAKAFHPGRAAANGHLSVLLAQSGFATERPVLEGNGGVLDVLSRSYRSDRIIEGFGTSWELLDNSYKPYPCGIVNHPGIDAAIELSDEVDPERVERVQYRCHPLVPELMGRLRPRDGLEARFSAVHGAAVGLMYGRAGLPEYEDHLVTDAALDRLRARIELTPDDAIRRDEAILDVELSDGMHHVAHVEHARGSADRPLTEAELEDKVRALIEPRMPGRTSAILAAVAALDDGTDIRALTDLLVPDQAAR